MLPLRGDGNRTEVLKTKQYKILANLRPSCSSYRSVERTLHAKELQRINGKSRQEYRVTIATAGDPQSQGREKICIKPFLSQLKQKYITTLLSLVPNFTEL